MKVKGFMIGIVLISGVLIGQDNIFNGGEAVMQKVRNAVVQIYTKGKHKVTTYHGWKEIGSGSGTGFFISKSGEIATAYHVIRGAAQVFVTTANKKQYEATIVGVDTLTDVALLKVNTPGDFDVLTFGDSDALKQGMKIIAVGNPVGLPMSFSSGIASAVNRGGIGLWPIESYIQVDASINPGNSGGPLLDQNGSVVGINDASRTTSGGSIGLNFALPSNLVSRIIEVLRQGTKPNHPFIGVTVLALDQKTKDTYGIVSPVTEGALVMGVASGSGAVSGIRFRDIITHVAGKAVIEPQDLRTILADKQAGDAVTVDIIRGGERSSISVTTGMHPGIPQFDPATFCRVYLGFDIARTNVNGTDRFVVGRMYRSESAQSSSSIKPDMMVWKVAPGSPSGIFEDVFDEEQLSYAFSESVFENDRMVALEFVLKRTPDDTGGVRVRVSGQAIRNSF